jgi:hypothetical protein
MPLRRISGPGTELHWRAGSQRQRRPCAFALWAALCLAGPSLFGCSGDERAPPLGDGMGRPVEGCERFSYRSCNILSAACESELFGLVGCLRGENLAAAGPPPVSLLSETEAMALVLQEAEEPSDAAPDADFSASVRGLELLGLVDPGLISSQSDVVDVTIQSVAAFYQPSTRAVVIIDRGEPLDDLDANGTLAHEFVHAWQDRRHDLGNFDGDTAADSDLALARTSVVEGEAMLYQLLLILAYRGVNLKQANYAGMFQGLVAQGEQLASTQGSPMVTASGIFPYTYGARYMGEHWLDGSHEELDQIFEQPPASTLEVMWEGSVAMPAIEPLQLMPAPLDGYRFVTDDVAGAWVMFSRLLELSGTLQDASTLRELSARWRGDRFWVYQSEDAALDTAVVWWIDWADAPSATQFAQAMARFHPDPAAIRVEVQGTRTRVVVAERSADLDAWALRAADGSP